MHSEHFPPTPGAEGGNDNAARDRHTAWWRELNRYQWFVLAVAALGWMFDTMDQQLFNLARRPAMRKLLEPSPGVEPDKQTIAEYSGYATSIFLIGWGSGGIAFGILGDLIGRAKTMMLTILLYSIFTGLSALSGGFGDFALYRFLTGLGVGGEFAVGVSLVAEVMPDRARPFALGLLQALSALGNVTAAVTGIVLAYLARAGIIGESWRIMFVVGTLPALLSAFVFWRLKEPERWRLAAAKFTMRERLGSYFGELFQNPRWTKNAVVGLLLASSGIIGLWGIGFFSIDLQRYIFHARLLAEGFDRTDVTFYEDVWAGWTSVTLNIGAFLGIYAFSYVTHYIGRRRAFAIAFVLAMLSTAFVFWSFRTIADIFTMIPLMGFCQLALFGGYAIYFPELFPTRLRSTGTSFCYNVARFVAAAGPAILGLLTSRVFAGYPDPEPMRYAGVTMCAIFVVGLLTLPFAPETKGQPLPE
ncbi:MAG TPA: MFS transporter [Gemmataceae bacterium]|nr:MFS transporter [Gemmataceae bacterium]